jgi:hypothetical protein
MYCLCVSVYCKIPLNIFESRYSLVVKILPRRVLGLIHAEKQVRDCKDCDWSRKYRSGYSNIVCKKYSQNRIAEMRFLRNCRWWSWNQFPIGSLASSTQTYPVEIKIHHLKRAEIYSASHLSAPFNSEWVKLTNLKSQYWETSGGKYLFGDESFWKKNTGFHTRNIKFNISNYEYMDEN